MALDNPEERLEALGTPVKEGGWSIRDVIETILLTLVIYGLLSLGFQNFRIIGSSMEPNFQQGEYLVANKVIYHLRPVERGEVIIFRPPMERCAGFLPFFLPPGEKCAYIKRVMGLPGEEVEIKKGQVFINGEPLEEPYVVKGQRQRWGPTVVGPNEYFVLGDNRKNSSDSRNWGMLPRQNIIGQAWISYWPPQELGLVPHYSFASD